MEIFHEISNIYCEYVPSCFDCKLRRFGKIFLQQSFKLNTHEQRRNKACFRLRMEKRHMYATKRTEKCKRSATLCSYVSIKSWLSIDVAAILCLPSLHSNMLPFFFLLLSRFYVEVEIFIFLFISTAYGFYKINCKEIENARKYKNETP